jgi:hypothetical protein
MLPSTTDVMLGLVLAAQLFVALLVVIFGRKLKEWRAAWEVIGHSDRERLARLEGHKEGRLSAERKMAAIPLKEEAKDEPS